MFKYQFLLLSLAFLVTHLPKPADSSAIGVCYKKNGEKKLPSPADVVSMYQTNHIGRMRLYEPDSNVFEALRGSGIQLSVGVHDDDIENLATSEDTAAEWVQNNIRPYWPDTHFRYITVGKGVIPSDSAKFILPAIRNLHNALRDNDLWRRIKVTTVVSPSVLDVDFPPSAGKFSDDAIEYLQPIAQYLYTIGAPLLANVYPYFAYVENPKHVSLPYALFTAEGDVFSDGGVGYSNLFDATVDAFYAALEKSGAPNITIVVSETGWPSAGSSRAAKIFNAKMYNENLMKHVLSHGTPKRPGEGIETYLFTMFDEEDRSLEGELKKRKNKKQKKEKKKNNFGLFYTDKKPVYPVDFNITVS